MKAYHFCRDYSLTSACIDRPKKDVSIRRCCPTFIGIFCVNFLNFFSARDLSARDLCASDPCASDPWNVIFLVSFC